MKTKQIVVVGATGRVGREMLSILSDVGVPAENVVAIASERSAGSVVPYGETDQLIVRDLAQFDFAGCDFALFSAGSKVSAEYASKASAAGCIVIDNTSFFRMHDGIPLIVPEINFANLQKYHSKIISNPNCSTIQMVMALKPLHDAFGLREVVVSTYQSVSGAGQKGVDELMIQIEQVSAHKATEPHHFNKQIAFNVIPQIDEFTSSGYTKEELKMINETRKIFNLPNLVITATCVRVPVIVGHAVSVFAKFEKATELGEALSALRAFPGVKVVDNPNNFEYTTPLDVASTNDVYVSRLRKHPDIENALSFWCVADNVRKGAALNTVQIAQMMAGE